jgi:hypothetical protein
MDSGTIKIFHDKLLRLLEQNFRKDSGNKELVLQIYIIIIQKFDMASSSYYEDIADQLLCIDAWADESYEAFPVFS